MKKTTYIMMGMLVATVCLIVGGVAFLSTQGDERVSSLITLKGEEKVLSLPACKYVMVKKEGMHNVEVKPGIVESYHNFVLENDFQLVGTENPAPALKIASDLEPFIRTELQGDTLVIGISTPCNQWPEGLDERHFLRVSTSPVSLFLPKDVSLLNVDLNIHRANLLQLNRPKFTVNFSTNVEVNHCNFDTLVIENTSYIHLNKGRAEHLYVNSDRVRNWQVNADSFDIDTEYIKGNRFVRNQISSKECRRLIYMPTGPDAKLQLEVTEPIEVILNDE